MNLGERIKFFRKKINLSQEEFGKKCGLSRNAIYNYENNKRKPTIETLEKMAKILNITTHQLLITDESLKVLEDLLNEVDIKSGSELVEKKSKEIRSKYAESEEFCLFDIDRMFLSTILDIMSEACTSSALDYSIKDFSMDELNEISDFVFNSYKLKINEILERHKLENQKEILEKGFKIANNILKKKEKK
ncbi:helix-turn-helix domain-containing protein [Eubacterium multiforme]|uniref:Transcriptional regulator with XRE-family HTH domain n=1 Tax=Eubacterium multiforme TaxID=83339 RepID=A0ABT9UWI4_9FIRM|nr:helix-turn-helix transcriptional regulator [Eubacterium multiforme]MDQ0150670.1 transcriptional regulator with XRE-family HTH domain [Eubacterium multiforme]